MSEYRSAESLFGWEQSYLSLPIWMERIREVHKTDNRMRDELDYYMCFFVQCFSLKDWMTQHGVMKEDELNLLINSHDEMRICRDICNRYKHLALKRKPSIDADWQISRSFDPVIRSDWYWVIHFGGGKRYELWDLMSKCMEFWEALVASYDLDIKNQAFNRKSSN